MNSKEFTQQDVNNHLSDILTHSLMEQIGRPSLEKMSEITEELESQGEKLVAEPKARFVEETMGSRERSTLSSEFDLEGLYLLQDKLIDIFEKLNANDDLALDIEESIKITSKIIRKNGGEVDTFIPLEHMSQLSNIDKSENAEAVIKRTLACYKGGSIKSIDLNGDTLSIQIENSDYNCIINGEISPIDLLNGNEAIDYVYTRDGGKLSVKEFNNKKWVDKSDLFDIGWDIVDLNGKETDDNLIIPEEANNESNDNNNTSVEKKEEFFNYEEGVEPINDEYDINDDFPIKDE